MSDDTKCPDCPHRLSRHRVSSSENPETIEGCMWCACRHRALCPCGGCEERREPYIRHWFVLVKIEDKKIVKTSTLFGPFSRHLQVTRHKDAPLLRVGPGMHGHFIVADGADLVFWSDLTEDDPGWRLNYDSDDTVYSDLVMWATPTDEPGQHPDPWKEEFKWHDS